MGERDRYQSYGGRNEGRYQGREDYPRDREDERRMQSRDRDWNYREDRDYERSYGSRYPEQTYGQNFGGQDWRRYPGPFGSFEDQRTSESDRSYGYGSSQQPWERGYSGERNQPYRSAYGMSYGRMGEGYSSGGGEWQGRYSGYGTESRDRGDYRGREEGFGQQMREAGQQMREAGQRIMGKVKRAFRGPKGYKRSDERIREDVSDRLSQEDELDPSEIEVMVSNGDVTLTGTVETRREKFLAEE
ncbi:MAG TPA: BON domain-containing protein, partial [Polyangiales bacterium]|nr:BON domain-containing protein [Polyangiales bacterium]